MWSDLTLGPSFKVKRGLPKLKVLITRSFLFLEVTSTYRKSWAKNLLMWSDFTLGSSFKIKRWLIGFGEFSFSGGYNLYRFSYALGHVDYL